MLVGIEDEWRRRMCSSPGLGSGERVRLLSSMPSPPSSSRGCRLAESAATESGGNRKGRLAAAVSEIRILCFGSQARGGVTARKGKPSCGSLA